METTKRTIKPFWTIVIVAVCAIIAGGVIMWVINNNKTQDDLDSVNIPKSNHEQQSELQTQASSSIQKMPATKKVSK